MPTESLGDSVVAAATTQAQLEIDAELARLRAEVNSLRGRYKAALVAIDRERERADALVGLRGIEGKQPPKRTAKASRHPATMCLMLSDIHCEETVRPEAVNGMNAYDLDV